MRCLHSLDDSTLVVIGSVQSFSFDDEIWLQFIEFARAVFELLTLSFAHYQRKCSLNNFLYSSIYIHKFVFYSLVIVQFFDILATKNKLVNFSMRNEIQSIVAGV